MEQFLTSLLTTSEIDIVVRLLVATALGLLIGTEREIARKTAGMRTYALTALGSALFVIIAQEVSRDFVMLTNFDPLRVGSQVVVGLGFLCAGIIFLKDQKIKGLTTAAGVWVTGGIGMAAGYGLFTIAISSAVIVLFVFTILWYVERLIVRAGGFNSEGE